MFYFTKHGPHISRIYKHTYFIQILVYNAQSRVWVPPSWLSPSSISLRKFKITVLLFGGFHEMNQERVVHKPIERRCANSFPFTSCRQIQAGCTASHSPSELTACAALSKQWNASDGQSQELRTGKTALQLYILSRHDRPLHYRQIYGTVGNVSHVCNCCHLKKYNPQFEILQ